MASASSGDDGVGHHNLLRNHCRICGQKRVDSSNNRGVPIKNHPQLCRLLRYLHEIEVERESEEIYPTRACDLCIAKLKNVSICHKGTSKMALENVFELATKLHTDCQDEEMSKLARQFPAADFWAHSSAGMCTICDDSQKDTFPPEDPVKKCLLIEVELNPSIGVYTICGFQKTDRMVVPKREIKDVAPKEAAKPVAPKVITVTLGSDSPTPPPSKKAKVPEAVNSAPNPVAGSKATALSSGHAWTQFNEALGRNRRSRCDKLAELLKWSNMDNPKIISDLKASGIDFKISPKRHLTPNVEFKSTLAKSKRLLTAFPIGKRTLMLFRAITDTVTDGRLDFVSHVGIHINLDHQNMGFLVRKIKAKQAAANPPPAVESRPDRPIRGAPGRPKSTLAPDPTAKHDLLSKVPSGITISKINKSEGTISPLKLIAKPGPRSSKINCYEVSESPSPVSNQSMILERPPEVADDQTDEIVLSEKKILKAVNDIEKKHLPANRQMKTDVVFDCLHLRPDAPSLLAAHGIIYNPKLGKHHLRVLSGQRKIHKTAIIKITDTLNKYEWAAVMAKIIFGLLHTEDTLTLRVAGIMIDPFHEAAPLSFRMGFMLKHLLISKEDPNSSRTLLSQILRACEIDPQTYDERTIEDALIQLLYCERSDAQNLLLSTKKPIKISLKSNKPLTTNSYANSKPSTSKGSRTRKIIYYKDEPFEEEEELSVPQTKALTSRRGRPLGSRKVVKQEEEDEDVEYSPKVKIKTPPAAPSTRGHRGNRGGIRGPYKKTLLKRQKEAEERQKNVTFFDANVLVEVNSEMLDPLAMPDPALVNPMDVSIKTEVIDDMSAVDGSMIAINEDGEQLTSVIEAHEHPVLSDDPIGLDNHPGLLISSVTGNAHDLGCDSPAQAPNSVDIGPNPLAEESLEVTGDKDPVDVPTEQDETILGKLPAESEKEHEEADQSSEKAPAEKDPVEDTLDKEPAEATKDSVDVSTDDHSQEKDRMDLDTNEEDAPMEEDSNEHEPSPSTNSNSVDSQQQSNGNAHTPQPSDDPLSSSFVANDESSANSMEIEDPFGESELSLPNSDSQVASEPFPSVNGVSDPFEVSSDPFATSEDLENNINDLLQTNSLGNGESNPPTLLDDEANDLLDQLVNFQPAHKGTQHSSNSSST